MTLRLLSSGADSLYVSATGGPQSGLKSQGAGTAGTVVGSDEAKSDQEDSAKERERAEEEDGALGDGHRSAAGGRSGPGVKAPSEGDQGVPGGKQKGTRNRVVTVHQQENARLSEWVRGLDDDAAAAVERS